MHAAGADAGAPAAETASGVEPSREAFAAPPPESPRAEEPGAAAAAAASAREEPEERPRREDASSASASTPRAPSVGPSAEPPRDSPEGGAAPGPAAGAASRASSGEAAAADSEIGASELPPPGPLAASFAASEARVAPPGDRSFTVDLRYAFASPRELDDFRSRRAWLVEDGRLRHRSAVDAQLESVAWFRLPLSATLELARPAVVALGFASLRVAPGDGESALLWAAGDGPDIDAPDDARRALPLASGVVHVVFFAEGVRITSGETETTFDVPVPKNGRFVVELPPGGELLSLRLEGALSEAWAEERVRFLESLPGGAAGGASED